MQIKLSTVSGSYDVKVEGTTSSVAITNGKVTVDGRAAQVFSSHNPKYPTSAGWFSFVQKDGKLGVARVSASVGKLEVAMVRGDEVLTASVKEKEPEPEPNLPLKGNIIWTKQTRISEITSFVMFQIMSFLV